MIFLTVGTQFPFDRLVKAVDEVVTAGLIREKIFAQIGNSSYRPRNFEVATTLKKELFDKHLSQANSVISHAGVGTIAMALDNKKPLLVMPRLRKYGEVVHDHQVEIARKFEELGYLLVAYSVEELPEKIEQLKSFVPRPRKSQAKAVANRIRRFLNSLSEFRQV
jgi:UDP-N-acetylglucosamine transferase subunit ALG13